MGLDGISINQLRVTPENNSSELNNVARFNLNNEHKVVDGLSDSQKVDPDKEKDHEDPELSQQFVDLDNEDEDSESVEEVIKYDLSESNKYILKLDEQTNNILIVEKATSNIVQKINADELSSYVGFLSNSQGSIVNRKF